MKDFVGERPTLCIGILTMNEAPRIAGCIASALFADQIIVIDSGSTDGTLDLAAKAGAEVHMHAEWDGFGTQRNRMLQYVRCDYIFFLDADEIIPPELAAEIQAAVRSRADAVWQVQWSQVAYGRPLSLMSSTGGIRRLFRMDNLERFEGVVHEGGVLKRPNVPILRFHHRLPHYSRESVYGSLLKLAQYVQLGAVKRAKKGQRGGVLRGAASAVVLFVRLYILRRGMFCGPEGFLFCFFVALECFFRYAALRYDKPRGDGTLARR